MRGSDDGSSDNPSTNGRGDRPMRDLKDEIEEAQAKVAHLRIRAERPSARLEDEFALEKARNRLPPSQNRKVLPRRKGSFRA